MNDDLTKSNQLPIYWVGNSNDLYQLIDEIDQSQIVALDTEFIKVSTYYPFLALIQINTGKAIYLVDAPRLALHDFWQALSEVPTMVWYSCSEDLAIFYLLANCPPLTNIFDVQIALEYLTGKSKIGYAQAVNDVLGVYLDKSESRSDWLSRPLSQEQECYAANDVRYLLMLYKATSTQLHQRQLYTCAKEDSNLLAKEIHTYHNTPVHQLYLNYIKPIYNAQQINAFKELFTWREMLARSTNQPRNFIISKQALQEIVQQLPKTIKTLAHTTLNRQTIRIYGNEILKQIKTAKSLPAPKLPLTVFFNYNNKNKPFDSALNQAICQYSQKTGIPPHLLLKKRWIKELLILVAKKSSVEQLSDDLKDGYRYPWVIDEILPLLMKYQTQIQAEFELQTSKNDIVLF